MLVGASAIPAAAQQPQPTAAKVIDGPTADIASPTQLGASIARDGTGGLVYLKQVAGVQHVFVSTLSGGSFSAPVQVDSGLGTSSQPVIAAGNSGLLLVAFVSGGELYVADKAASSTAFAAPVPLASAVLNPAISIANSGKAYLAFIAGVGAGDDVRLAYFNNGRWGVAPTPLSISPADSPGTGTGRPEVAAAGDGVGIVVWGEAGHVYSRRSWGTAVSVATQQADATLAGCSEQSADEPVVGTEGDSSYADVAFHEMLSCGYGGTQQSRVLMNRLQGSQYLGLSQPDALTASSGDGADDPQMTMGEYGHGWVTSVRASSNALIAAALGDNGQMWGTTQVNGTAELAQPDGLPATAGLFSDLIAWQQSPGSSGQPEIRLRYAPAGGTLGPEIVASSATQGPTDADAGLAAAGDVAGDSAVAWVQGTPGAEEIVAAQLYQPPAPFGPSGTPPYSGLPQPTLNWSQSKEPWGPITYSLAVDSQQVAQTQATSLVVPAPLPDGPHSWSVTATNPAGQTAQTRTATVFVDTIPPTAQIAFSGTKLINRPVNTFLSYADPPPPGQPGVDASGVASALVYWGDGSLSQLHPGWHRSFHTYIAPGTYTITAVVTDRAGNVGRAVLSVKILKPKPKPKPKPKKPKPGHRRRA